MGGMRGRMRIWIWRRGRWCRCGWAFGHVVMNVLYWFGIAMEFGGPIDDTF